MGGKLKYLFCRILTFPRVWWKISVFVLTVSFAAGWGLFTEAEFLELIRMSAWLAGLLTLGFGSAVMVSVFFVFATERAYGYCHTEATRREHEDRQRWYNEQFEKCLGECIVKAGGGTPVWKPDAVKAGEKS